ncbi:MAG: winged helix-turn-helix domain-containing tetratricopeptide repeat protein, partial [Steroidobacteraceae bacterium]
MHKYEFAGFRLDVLKRQLRNAKGRPLELPTRAFDALVFLVEHRGEDISKDQVMKAVWPDTVVEENNLNQAVFALRRALGDTASDPHFIMTLPGRGYRFIAEVLQPAERRRTIPKFAAVGLATTCAIALIAAWALRAQRTPRDARIESVAVLPFKALLPEQSDSALELGMTDSLIAQISTLPGVKVSSLSAVRRFAPAGQDPIAAGKALKVESVLESSILRQGERIRVTARLLRISDGHSLWAGKFDEPLSDILTVQDSIAERVMTTLAPQLSAAGTLAKRPRPTENAEAYQLYASGFYNQQRRDMNGLPAAVEKFEAALVLDPGYVQAWGALSRTLAAQAAFGTKPPSAVLPRAKQAALRAVELDPSSGEAQAAFAHVLNVYERQFKQAAEHYSLAKRLSPEVPEVFLLSSMNEAQLGHVERSLAEARHALEMEPASLLLRANLGMLLYFARSYDDAEVQLERVVELLPTFDHAQNFLGRTLLAKGDIDGARLHFAARSNVSPGSYANPGWTDALAGRTAQARAEIDRLLQLAAEGFGVHYDLATIHAALGEKRLACKALDAAIRDGSS